MVTKKEARYLQDKVTLDTHQGADGVYTPADLMILRILPENYKIWKEKYDKGEEEEPKPEMKPEEQKKILTAAYKDIKKLLRKYCDLRKDAYTIIALWIIGTYFHDEFQTFPYLFFNAMRGSGKSRTMRLVTSLSKDGEVMASPTEAVLFRTTGTLGIDELEGIAGKESSAIRELLNASYKKGVTISRMKKKGEDMVVEKFEPYRPIVMANIAGMEEVLEDRCISIVLEKSNIPCITKLIEAFESECTLISVVKSLNSCVRCSLCTVYIKKRTRGEGTTTSSKGTVGNSGVRNHNEIFDQWNDFIIKKSSALTTPTTNTTYTTTTILPTSTSTSTPPHSPKLLEFFEKVNDSEIQGRNLELFMPLFLIAMNIDDKILDEVIKTASIIIKEKKHEEQTESIDVMVLDFISNFTPGLEYHSIKDLTREFRNFADEGEEWINNRWFGRALKRLNLIINKRRVSAGIELILDVPKALEKVQMFKEKEDLDESSKKYRLIKEEEKDDVEVVKL